MDTSAHDFVDIGLEEALEFDDGCRRLPGARLGLAAPHRACRRRYVTTGNVRRQLECVGEQVRPIARRGGRAPLACSDPRRVSPRLSSTGQCGQIDASLKPSRLLCVNAVYKHREFSQQWASRVPFVPHTTIRQRPGRPRAAPRRPAPPPLTVPRRGGRYAVGMPASGLWLLGVLHVYRARVVSRQHHRGVRRARAARRAALGARAQERGDNAGARRGRRRAAAAVVFRGVQPHEPEAGHELPAGTRAAAAVLCASAG